jgi:hypothetical protein
MNELRGLQVVGSGEGWHGFPLSSAFAAADWHYGPCATTVTISTI